MTTTPTGCVSVPTVVSVYPKSVSPTMQLMKEKIELNESQNQTDAFVVVDLGQASEKLEQFRRHLPRVLPFYAMKCNPDPEFVKFLAQAGVGFDCASKGEIEQILGLGVHPSRIVYANPCRASTHLQYAFNQGVDLMTFDDVSELVKIQKHAPGARLILRIQSTKNHKAKFNLNKKFGCDHDNAPRLLRAARAMGLNVVGISFHVGSLPGDASCYASTIKVADDVFTYGEKLGFNMKILDIGGGFPGSDEEKFIVADAKCITFEMVATTVSKALDIHFPASRETEIIAEPGRYFATTPFTIAVNIIAKKVIHNQNDVSKQKRKISPCLSIGDELDDDFDLMNLNEDVNANDKANVYYVNEGAYGDFNNVLTDHVAISPKVFSPPPSNKTFKSKIWGPTCDQLDCVMPDCELPDLDVGQWLYFENMGAYSICLSTSFNGFDRPKLYYVCSDTSWNCVYSTATQPSSTNSPYSNGIGKWFRQSLARTQIAVPGKLSQEDTDHSNS